MVAGARHARGLSWVCAGLMFAVSAEAMERGAGNYAVGAQTVAAGFMPPHKTTAFFSYFLYYRADSYRGDDGRSAIPDFELDYFAVAPRVIHTWGRYSNLNFTSGLTVVTNYLNVEGAGQKDIARGIDFLGLELLHISGSIGKWYWVSGSMAHIPVGHHDRTALVNTTKNMPGFSHQLGITWLPSIRWDFSLNPNITFNLRNPDTEYRSGTIAGVTGGISYRPFSDLRWQLGVGGFYSKQLADDRIQGKRVPGGNRLEKSSLGPQLTFWPTPGSALQMKWQREFEVENAPRGDLFWLACMFPF